MALSDAERSVLETRLAEAREELHRLELGTATQSVGYEGEQVTFRNATPGSVRRYIADLEAQLGLRAMARRPGVRV